MIKFKDLKNISENQLTKKERKHMNTMVNESYGDNKNAIRKKKN